MTNKSLSNSALNLIVGKIHKAYTLACDELFMRGYFTQDDRMAIGGLIGDLLTQLRMNLLTQLPGLGSTVVNPDDVDLIVSKDSIVDEVLAEYKAGARHNSGDKKHLQSIHDAAVELGASCPMMIFKEESGRYRWVLFSSSAYEDRDREIVSTKAQEEDCDRLNQTGVYGPLRWWHVGQPHYKVKGDWKSYTAGNGLDIGECDASVMIGRIRVETGTFYHDEVGEALKEVAHELSVSIGFSHPIDEPNRKGEFNNMHTFERSLLPKGKQSNYFASVPIIEKESKMDMNQKLDKLKEHLGGIASLVMDQADQTDKAAAATGAKFKAKADKPDPDDDEEEEEDPKTGKPKRPKKGVNPFADMDEAKTKEFIASVVKEVLAESTNKSEKESELATTLETIQTGLKAASDNDAKISEALTTINTALKDNSKAIKSLQGDLPKSLSRLARSNADDNTVDEAKAKQAGPQQGSRDGANEFFDWALNQGEQKIPAG